VSVPSQLVTLHRWLGVFLCLLVAAWFASGAVLMYVPFPSLSDEDRIAASADLNTSAVTVSPVEVIRSASTSGPIDRIRLIARGERPLYVLEPRGAPVLAIWADDGRSAAVRTAAEAADIVLEFSGAPIDRIEGPLDFDQWIVHQGFDRQRPYFRVHLDDPEKTVVYVSQRSGEILQRTSRVERAWNYVGAVVHWIYPTVLRRHWAAWDQVVWWLSLIGIGVAILGIWLGVDRLLAALRSRNRRFTPFRGWMKWHHLLGLFAGAFVLTWMFSGWLSMDHGRVFSMPDPAQARVDDFRGISIAQAANSVSVDSIRRLGALRELEIAAVAQSPVIITRSAGEQTICLAGTHWPCSATVLPDAQIVTAVRQAWPEFGVASAKYIAPNDTYRQVRQSRLPETTIRVELDDPEATWVHVDAASGVILAVEDRGRRLYRWLYHGLHSWDFPWLIERRPLWDALMLSLLALGFAFSVTGAYLGAKRLLRTVTSPRHSGSGQPSQGSKVPDSS
jgi:hypothetical protein